MPPPNAPFKGEAFPAYVAQRMARPSATNARTVTTALLVTQGPSTKDLLDKPEVAASPAKRQPADTPSPSASSFAPPPLSVCKSFGPMKPTTSKTPTRPSLSDQLKTISQGAQSITTQLRSSFQLHEPHATRKNAARRQQSSGNGGFLDRCCADCLLQATTIALSVGRLQCRFPCPVFFASDRCSYLFQHPFEAKEIQMVMFYRDMKQLQLSLHDRSLKFRVHRVLDQFGEDYQPANPQHFLKLVFATATEAQTVKLLLAKLKQEFGNNG